MNPNHQAPFNVSYTEYLLHRRDLPFYMVISDKCCPQHNVDGKSLRYVANNRCVPCQKQQSSNAKIRRTFGDRRTHLACDQLHRDLQAQREELNDRYYEELLNEE